MLVLAGRRVHCKLDLRFGGTLSGWVSTTRDGSFEHGAAYHCNAVRGDIVVLVSAFAFSAASIGIFCSITSAAAQPAFTQSQLTAQATYNSALLTFRTILSQRRAQIAAKQPLPARPGQALYLARVGMMSAYKDLTDAVPPRIGRGNKFAIPPAYFDAANEALIDEYVALYQVMHAPPPGAQASRTPFKDVADLGTAIARAKGLDTAGAEAAGRIALGIFFGETNGNQNIGNARSDKYKGSMQAGVAEDANGRRAWAALLPGIAAVAPAVARRDEVETARIGAGDQRFNHWTAMRNGLMNSHAELFARIPEIVRMLPDEIDQMKVFQLIQIIPSPTRRALASGNFAGTRISDPRIMGYLRNNSMFAFGKADRARTSATFREILDAMWLFTEKFERARALHVEIRAGKLQ